MDTNKMPTEMLAQFDAAFRAKFGCGIAEVSAAQDEDSMAMMGAAMWAWQASREAVVIELPYVRSYPVNEAASDVDYYIDEGKHDMKYLCRKAIEAQGLRVAE